MSFIDFSMEFSKDLFLRFDEKTVLIKKLPLIIFKRKEISNIYFGSIDKKKIFGNKVIPLSEDESMI